jgi:hypothetical protein
MASVREVVDAAAEQIAAATGLRPYPWIVDNLDPPGLVVIVDDLEVGAMGLGQLDITLNAMALTARSDARTGTQSLFDYLDPGADNAKSVWRAIYADPSLGLAGTNAMVRRMRGMSTEEVAGTGYFGALFEIVVLTSGA